MPATDPLTTAADSATPPPAPPSLRNLSAQQWRSGIAAWLGWLFDGLDMHLYTLVATPFVAELLATNDSDPDVGRYGSIIMAAFLLGWALGGGFFGRLGDLLGRSRALNLTILTYALFTGLAYFATTWWHLMIFRFLAALGIGGEWAVGASLLAETWPKHWRHWIAAVLQTAVNIGILAAALAGFLLRDAPPRSLFLVGVLPAFLVLWIRHAVPETQEWHDARAAASASHSPPRIADLFTGSIRRTTYLTIAVCAASLSAHWAFMFWFQKQLRSLPDVASMSKGDQTALVATALALIIAFSTLGNFIAAALARSLGYRRTIAILCLAYFLAMLLAYLPHRSHTSLLYFLPLIGLCQGVFALFTMYLPPLFPTLLRTTGAGFCYNIGRIAAAIAAVVTGVFASVHNYNLTLLAAATLFLPAAAIALLLPEPPATPSPPGRGPG